VDLSDDLADPARWRRPGAGADGARSGRPGLCAGDRGLRRCPAAPGQRRFTEYVTDYFDKSLGHEALAAFIRGYVQPQTIPSATILYIEDSRVVARPPSACWNASS
jgi:hypothetical protein